MSISAEASAKMRPRFTGLIDRTVIETMLERDLLRHRVRIQPPTDPVGKKGTWRFDLTVAELAIATPADQPLAPHPHLHCEACGKVDDLVGFDLCRHRFPSAPAKRSNSCAGGKNLFNPREDGSARFLP
jgi:hypothetical protein